MIPTSTRDPCMYGVHNFYVPLFDLGSGKRNSFELGAREVKQWLFLDMPAMHAIIGKPIT